ncbi:DUF3617 domain-containing protein [Ramlibacter sp. MMS24-I3-19]|uniref:DUF3617 domain-containing protein n=1 Tax=Ramlibacter sp. MMS24-I3-19 TaxID=3416606 RepID=UPI003CFC1F63
MRVLILTLAAGCLAASMPLAAQTLKPGLWDMQARPQGDPEMQARIAKMRKDIESLPPDQRKQAEAMMAAHGMEIGSGPGGMSRMRICLTPEMVERNQLFIPRSDCHRDQQRSGSKVHLTYTCTRPRSTGDVQMTVNSPESYALHADMTDELDGTPKTTTVDGNRKWVSADCGQVKPIRSE